MSKSCDSQSEHIFSKPAAVIFGAGLAGQRSKTRLQKEYDICAFIDNDSTKQGKVLEGTVVWSLPQLVDELKKRSLIIFIATEFVEQIEKVVSLLTNAKDIRVLSAAQMSSFQFGESQAIHDNALRTLRILTKALESANITHHIDAGTLLGLYRDRQLIPWDDDLDIALTADQLNRLNAATPFIKQRLNEAIGDNWTATTSYAQHSFKNVPANAVRSIKLSSETEHLPAIDLFIKYQCDMYSDYVLASRGIRMPAEPTKSLKKIQVAGNWWWVPADPDSYLTAHYGDWRTPQPNWSLQDLQNTEVFSA